METANLQIMRACVKCGDRDRFNCGSCKSCHALRKQKRTLANPGKEQADQRRWRYAARNKIIRRIEIRSEPTMITAQNTSQKTHVATKYAGSSVWHWLVEDWQVLSKARNAGMMETVQKRAGADWHLYAWRA